MGDRKSTIIVIILILISILSFNNSLSTIENESPYQNINSFNNEGSKALQQNNKYFWDPIEVVSEPIPGYDYNVIQAMHPDIAVEDDKIYVVWADMNNTNSAGFDNDIFYRYYDGSKWSDIQVISEPVPDKDTNDGNSYFPSIAVENGKIYVVWVDSTNYNKAGDDLDIFLRCNTTGNSWGNIQVISEPISNQDTNTGHSYYPEIVVENGNYYVIWPDESDIMGAGTDYDIFYRHYDGTVWGDIQLISEPTLTGNSNYGYSTYPDINVDNGNIYTVWHDNTVYDNSGGDYEIFYRCNLSGSGWDDIQVLSEPVPGMNTYFGDSLGPSIDVENGKIYVTYYENGNILNSGTNADIFYRCNLTGTGWEDIQVISEPIPGHDFNTGFSTMPKIAVENNKIYIVWDDTNDTNNAAIDWDIFYRSNLTGNSWGETEVVSEPIQGFNYNTANNDFETDLAISFGKLYVIWRDDNNTNGAGTNLDIMLRSKSIPFVFTQPLLTPTFGNTSTNFNFSISYIHPNNIPPSTILVNINGVNFSMLEVDKNDNYYIDGKNYFYETKLNISLDHEYYFWASENSYTKKTQIFNNPDVFNTPPEIITEDNVTAVEDIYYEVKYEYNDIDLENINQTSYWYFSTNAAWLSFNTSTQILNGIPANEHVGVYWVEITVFDTLDYDTINFTLTVLNVNDPPMIITEDIKITFEDEYYETNYTAIDIDTPVAKLKWSYLSNAFQWLKFNLELGILYGTPENSDVGNYWINVSVTDGNGGSDFTNFTLSVLNVNDPPVITTEDVLKTSVNILYEVDYNAVDVDNISTQLSWSLITNATWLSIDTTTGILTGIPLFKDIGWYNVNVTVEDGDGGIDWHEFILTVTGKIENNNLTSNKPPNIITTDLEYATVDELYYVDYEAEDDRTPVNELIWMLNTNASWLYVGLNSGILSGTPQENNLGWFWVNISVLDGEGGITYHNFTIKVTKPSITPPPPPPPPPPNNPPALNNGKITPSEGDTGTEFTFSVHYFDADNDAPTFIQVVIDNKYYNMTLKTSNASNGTYEYNTKLSEGPHTYYFTASDGIDTVSTNNFTVNVNKAVEKSEELYWFGLSWIVILIVIVVLILLFVFLKRKKSQEEELVVPVVSQPSAIEETVMEDEMEE